MTAHELEHAIATEARLSNWAVALVAATFAACSAFYAAMAVDLYSLAEPVPVPGLAAWAAVMLALSGVLALTLRRTTGTDDARAVSGVGYREVVWIAVSIVVTIGLVGYAWLTGVDPSDLFY